MISVDGQSVSTVETHNLKLHPSSNCLAFNLALRTAPLPLCSPPRAWHWPRLYYFETQIGSAGTTFQRPPRRVTGSEPSFIP